MVGAIGNTSPAAPVRPAHSGAGAARIDAPRPPAKADWVDISNLGGMPGIDPTPGPQTQRALNQSASGDTALKEISGLLDKVKALVDRGGEDYSSDDGASRQVQVDALLASVDRLAGTARFEGTPLLDGSAAIAASGRQITLPASNAHSLGATDSGGRRLTLADLRTGGRLARPKGDRAGASEVINAAIAHIANARSKIATFVSQTRGIVDSSGDSNADAVEILKTIREMLLSGGGGPVAGGNRPGIVQILK